MIEHCRNAAYELFAQAIRNAAARDPMRIENAAKLYGFRSPCRDAKDNRICWSMPRLSYEIVSRPVFPGTKLVLFILSGTCHNCRAPLNVVHRDERHVRSIVTPRTLQQTNSAHKVWPTA